MTLSNSRSHNPEDPPPAKGIPWRRLIFFGFSLLVTLVVFRILFQHILAFLFDILALAPLLLVGAWALVSGEMAASLPVSGIGGFGAYEGTMTFVLVMLNFSTDLAATLAISHRLFTQVYGLLQGVVGLLILMLPMFNREPRVISDPPQPPAF